MVRMQYGGYSITSTSSPSDRIRAWDEKKVADWLRSIGCGAYTDTFKCEHHLFGFHTLLMKRKRTMSMAPASSSVTRPYSKRWASKRLETGFDYLWQSSPCAVRHCPTRKSEIEIPWPFWTSKPHSHPTHLHPPVHLDRSVTFGNAPLAVPLQTVAILVTSTPGA